MTKYNVVQSCTSSPTTFFLSAGVDVKAAHIHEMKRLHVLTLHIVQLFVSKNIIQIIWKTTMCPEHLKGGENN
jgi:hypothetical protein